MSAHDNTFISAYNRISTIAKSPGGIDESSNEWVQADALFFRALHNAEIKDLLEVLELDSVDDLPFYMKVEIFQRLLLLDETRAESFRGFAEYLRYKTNNWNYLAEYFDRIADRLEREHSLS